MIHKCNLLKTPLILLYAVLMMMMSCDKSPITTGIWIEKEKENRIVTLEEEDGKYWISQFEKRFEVLNPHSKPFVQFPDRKIPITFSEDKASLFFFTREYIRLNDSKKGQYIGHWKSLSEDTQFLVKLDSNIDLNWDIIKGSEKPVRFYPKRTEKGVHFTIGHDTVSFEIKDGFLIDQNGKKYKKVAS